MRDGNYVENKIQIFLIEYLVGKLIDSSNLVFPFPSTHFGNHFSAKQITLL